MSGFLGKSFKQALGAVSKAVLEGNKLTAVKAVVANLPDPPKSRTVSEFGQSPAQATTSSSRCRSLVK